jgi:hypothetical protein
LWQWPLLILKIQTTFMSEVLFHTVQGTKVMLNATKWFAEREIANVTEISKLPHTIGFLTDKFTDLEGEVKLLMAEYITAPDKVKLAGKVNRTKNLLSASKAIGDFAKLFEQLEQCEKEISTVIADNVTKREELLKQAEEAIKEGPTSWKTATEKFTVISKSLKELPLVPDVRVEEIRVRFEQMKDEFFVKKQGHFEENEKILLDNLAHKIELCEKAEALQHSTEWKKATEEIQKLNDTWKTIGQIPRHRSDELWLRFNAAKDVFFAAKKVHYETVKADHGKNLEAKLALIEQAEALKDSRDWKKTTDAFTQLFEDWKKSGRVGDDKNDEVWNKFNAARNVFFKAKDEYYSSIKMNLDDNYTRKMVIVNRVEELANSTVVDWDGATTEVLEMMEDWKKIGRIPKEHGDGPWERFLAGKKKFFDMKDAVRAQRRSEGSKVLDDKLKRNRGYYNKLSRELELEKEVLLDFEDRLKNIHPGVRSFETKERYESIIEDARKKVEFLTNKLKDVKAGMDADDKEFKFLNRSFDKRDNKKDEHKSDRQPNARPNKGENNVVYKDNKAQSTPNSLQLQLEKLAKLQDKTEEPAAPVKEKPSLVVLEMPEPATPPVIEETPTEIVTPQTTEPIADVAEQPAIITEEVSATETTDIPASEEGNPAQEITNA